ncbi:MAG: hypothetical protein ACRCZS_13260 [Chroococcidiopsis sp.]
MTILPHTHKCDRSKNNAHTAVATLLSISNTPHLLPALIVRAPAVQKQHLIREALSSIGRTLRFGAMKKLIIYAI